MATTGQYGAKFAINNKENMKELQRIFEEIYS